MQILLVFQVNLLFLINSLKFNQPKKWQKNNLRYLLSHTSQPQDNRIYYQDIMLPLEG